MVTDDVDEDEFVFEYDPNYTAPVRYVFVIEFHDMYAAYLFPADALV